MQILLKSTLTVFVLAVSLLVVAAVRAEERTLGFDEEAALPAGWVVDRTNGEGEFSPWTVKKDDDAQSGSNVIAVAANDTGGVEADWYNVCWTQGLNFKNGMLSVRMRSDAGEGDRGGGIMWRVRDARNYYVMRYNPLERNFRLYTVRDGARRQLASYPGVEVAEGAWATIGIVHVGDHIEGWMDGKLCWAFDDATFGEAGGVGLWTKGDSSTSFDDLRLQTGADFTAPFVASAFPLLESPDTRFEAYQKLRLAYKFLECAPESFQKVRDALNDLELKHADEIMDAKILEKELELARLKIRKGGMLMPKKEGDAWIAVLQEMAGRAASGAVRAGIDAEIHILRVSFAGPGFMGVELRGLEDRSGVRLDYVLPGSPADKGGLRKDDVVLSINGTEVTNADEVRAQLRKISPGVEATYVIRRADEELTLVFVLGRRVD